MRRNLDHDDEIRDILATLVRVRSDPGSDMARIVASAAGFLDHESLDSRVYWVDKPYPCLVTRYKARSGDQQSCLVLHCHLDTAGAKPEAWRVDPFSAAEVKERVFGRGTIDCKGLAAIWIALMVDFARAKEVFPFDLLLVASSDEESGGEGVSRLVSETSEFRGAFLVIGEGGGIPLRSGGLRFYTLQTGEMEHSLLERSCGLKPRPLGLFGISRGLACRALTLETLWYSLRARVGMRDPKRSLVPGPLAREWVDDVSWAKSPLFAGGKAPVEMGRCLTRIPSGFAKGSRLGLRSARRALRRFDRKARILPLITVGYSDNRHFRQAGIPVMGFFPLAEGNSIAGCHGNNEYISHASLRFAENVLKTTILEMKEAVGG